MQRGSRQSGRGVSRRHFLREAATGAAVAASTTAAVGAQRSFNSSGSESSSATQPIRIPPEFSSAAQTPPASLQFPMARPGGATEFRFTWLTREPLVLHYDPHAATLTFKGLLPGVARGSPLLAAVHAVPCRWYCT
jgi:hypothetical protein